MEDVWVVSKDEVMVSWQYYTLYVIFVNYIYAALVKKKKVSKEESIFSLSLGNIQVTAKYSY